MLQLLIVIPIIIPTSISIQLLIILHLFPPSLSDSSMRMKKITFNLCHRTIRNNNSGFISTRLHHPFFFDPSNHALGIRAHPPPLQQLLAATARRIQHNVVRDLSPLGLAATDADAVLSVVVAVSYCFGIMTLWLSVTVSV